ncbi:MAG: hypothetical protein LIP77_12170 [Planctomycetes bacterium]|nr:hypothetical protein [Planctomycetota bacterium]
MEKFGLRQYLYEIVPGFAVNLMTILICNQIWPERNPRILQEFDEHSREAQARD